MSASGDALKADNPLPLDLPDEQATGTPRDKSPNAFRTISEVSEELDVPAHVLRFWETKFPQVTPMKRGGGRRYYRASDVALLRGIRAALYDEGLTIKGLQKLFRERGARHVAAVADGAQAAAPPAAPLEMADAGRLAVIIDQLSDIRDRLRAR
jgi:DNA-binding transcriptional MerR regulator